MGTGPVRDGAAVRRGRTALSDIADDRRAREKDQGVVVRLSSQARQLLAEQGGGETTPVEPIRGAGDTETRTPEGQTDSQPGSASRAGSGAQAGVQVGLPPAGPTSGLPDGQANLGAVPAAAKGNDGAKPAGQPRDVPGGPKKLSDEDKRVISALAARDTAVHAHEAAHQAVAGGLGGGASFSYETGPDGRQYAVGGEVPVALRSGRTPQETIANAQTVRSAALAPADPSSQDMAVAAQASQMEAQARQELTQSKPAGGGDRPATETDPDPTGRAAPDSEHDSLMIFSALKAERGGVVNGHLHSSGAAGCAFCSRAAARYA